MRLWNGPAVIFELTWRPESQKNDTIKLRKFVIEREGDFDIPFITYRHTSQEESAPHGLPLPCKTGKWPGVVTFSGAILFLSSTRLPASRVGFAIRNTDMFAVDCFSKEAVHDLVYLGRPADRGEVVLVSTKIYVISFHISAF